MDEGVAAEVLQNQHPARKSSDRRGCLETPNSHQDIIKIPLLKTNDFHLPTQPSERFRHTIYKYFFYIPLCGALRL